MARFYGRIIVVYKKNFMCPQIYIVAIAYLVQKKMNMTVILQLDRIYFS